ncbi:hypothetical protein Taro_048953 [Colocasia esculenta]|uniref:Myb/SANT-like domain-containing protein n=1 Tax=Colocasia esculenta TaxID=4460 RepID=A0A843X9M8_COLES|nr:hypothetical protein [Colocasia esculenta]
MEQKISHISQVFHVGNRGMNMWSDQMDITLLEMLDDELKLGGGAYLQFSEQTWEFMARGLNAITGANYPVSTIKSRIKFYKIVYYSVEDMVGTGEFAWDVDDYSMHGNNMQWNAYIAVCWFPNSAQSPSIRAHVLSLFWIFCSDFL